jgi:drug/metabolite transporter (DMT)-like permease
MAVQLLSARLPFRESIAPQQWLGTELGVAGIMFMGGPWQVRATQPASVRSDLARLDSPVSPLASQAPYLARGTRTSRSVTG